MPRIRIPIEFLWIRHISVVDPDPVGSEIRYLPDPDLSISDPGLFISDPDPITAQFFPFFQ